MIKTTFNNLQGESFLTINISNHKATVIERGVYYFNLSNYPNITKKECNDIIAFIKYEESYGRKTEILSNNEDILTIINNAVARLDTDEKIVLPEENKFVYHGTNIAAAREILSSGKLLSAAKVYGKTGAELVFEKRNSLWNDPADYFEYIMFCWGDNPTGDYVVLSENFPSEEDLNNGNFNPGVRFYFIYNDLMKHPGYTSDGYHAVKIKDEIILSNYLHSCIVPEQYKNELKDHALLELISKVHYLPQNKLGILEWNKKVYNFINKL